VTGSNVEVGITKLSVFSKRIAAESPYKLTLELLMHRNAQFTLFTD